MAGRILIADATATNRIILKVKLAAARYETVQAVDHAEALANARAARPDLVIADAHLPGGGGAGLCARLKADPETRAIPVLVIDGAPSQKARLAVLRAGADDYLAKPLDEPGLLAQVRALMRTRATYDELARRQDAAEALGFSEPAAAFARQARVGLIAPTPETALGWRRGLGSLYPAQFTAYTRTQALDAIGAGETPDAFVIAADLARHSDGIGLVSELRSRSLTRHAVISVPAPWRRVHSTPRRSPSGSTPCSPASSKPTCCATASTSASASRCATRSPGSTTAATATPISAG